VFILNTARCTARIKTKESVMTDKVKTKSELEADNVTAQLKARTPLLWVVTREEGRVERHLFQASINAKCIPMTWDIGEGVCDMAGKPDMSIRGADDGPADADVTLAAIRKRADNEEKSERNVWILRDLPGWLAGPIGMATLRKVRNLARYLPGVPLNRQQSLIIISPSGEVPPELAGHTTVVDWPLPDRNEIASILDTMTEEYNINLNGQREQAIDAAVGLNSEEAAACYSKSLVQLKTIDPKAVAAEKKRVIAKDKLLEWHDPLPGGLSAVGGLEGLKAWLKTRVSAYTPAARAYGLPMPKGLMLVGIPGCGKSLFAKAVASALGIPLLRLDLGALKSKFVGESEGNLRRALAIIESLGMCVVWLDEIEKALAGATQGAADGGVSSDALGTVLSWMQERSGSSFVIATANKIEDLPPELLRKGRFDELFFVDLPNATERVSVLEATMRKHERKAKVDFAAVAKATEGFTGSEIAELVPDAMFTAFNDNAREITTDDLIACAGQIVPLSETAKPRITALREWAKGKCRLASTPQTTAPATKPGRTLDLG
jgi:hypothetical protein